MNLQAPGVSIEASASIAEPGRAFALDAPSPCFPCRENDKARHEDSQQKCRTFVMIEVGVCVCGYACDNPSPNKKVTPLFCQRRSQ